MPIFASGRSGRERAPRLDASGPAGRRLGRWLLVRRGGSAGLVVSEAGLRAAPDTSCGGETLGRPAGGRGNTMSAAVLPTFSRAIDAFIGDLARCGRSQATRNSYRRLLNDFADVVRDK